eukprot:TRINITY_DN12030_c0_g5_i1.p2 TRINITY_DN12030_c0_g5~~TRINITY_DN12030_c0_g5_i1.p2  ORF type:complete len:231 (-),score=27.55 TRINITY_DN12030_c0_g5_i1:725-1417(-)
MKRGLQAISQEAENAQSKKQKLDGVVFVLEGAQLEVGKVGKNFALLNSDDHGRYLQNKQLDPAEYRPDICHQALLTILDSPLNKAGKIKGIFIKTTKNQLIQVNPGIRLPRTFRRFAGLIVQLLQQLSVRATDGSGKLLKLLKNDLSKHLPVGSRLIGFSKEGSQKDMFEFVNDLQKISGQYVFVVGAFSKGHIQSEELEHTICISQYPLSAAVALGRITNALERSFNIF